MFGKKEDKSDEKNLGQEKSDKLEEKLSQDILVHKMPKNYKAGTFSYNDYFNRDSGSGDAKGAATPVTSHKGKKTGLFIMIGGLLIIGLLAYGAFAYLQNPDKFNLASFFQKKTITPVVQTPTTPIVQTPIIVPVSTSTAEINTSTVEVSTSTPATTTPEIIIPIISDTDADGLSDQEEAILGTDANLADTDGDKYNDLTELVGSYNPAGSGKLTDNSNIKKYSSTNYKYNIIYPAGWKLNLVDGGASVIFTATDQSFVQVVTQANIQKMDIKSWYESEFSQMVSTEQIIKVNNWEGIKSADGLVIYLAASDLKNIYILSYTPISDQSPVYSNIFEAMIKSFTVVK